ncbi:hypothetical protein [Vibrio harveyi]|uniref:hypothetical protein n=1 Tax=Vibrio harveyi TaxID=669 RepID=UPI002119FD56|nr:hypothetical protein [Vibrio harveyi]MCQ9074152.1 hypothetical protein [Vibrio harveyi]
MKVVAIVESPLQLMSFFEYKFRNEKYEFKLVINKNTGVSSANYNVIMSLLKLVDVDVDSILEVDISSNFFGMIKSPVQTYKILKFLLGSDLILIGEYRSDYYHCMSNLTFVKNIVYLDDGNAIRRIKNTIERSHQSFRKIFPLTRPKEYRFFTSFIGLPDLINGKKIHYEFNDYSFTQSYLMNNDKVKEIRDDSYIYIIGSPLSEAGVCSYESEIKLIDILIDYIYKNFKGKKIKYIPHRRESKIKLDYVTMNDILIDELYLPIEFKSLMFKSEYMVGFYSSCFETIPMFFDDVNIISLKIPENFICSKWKEFVEEQYKAYDKNEKIKIVNVV